MAMEHTPVKELPWSVATDLPAIATPLSPRARPVRKLPVQRDWPAWVIVAVQIESRQLSGSNPILRAGPQ